MANQTVLILGAASDLARALAHHYAAQGWQLHLAARQAQRLQADVQDLKVRYGATAWAWEFDAVAYQTHADFWAQLDPSPELVVCVFGWLGDQQQAEQDWAQAQQIMAVNYLGATSIMQVAANDLAQRGRGCLVGISSVAGERGRGSNYWYGSAKAGFTAFLSGLRNRLHPQGVQVLTVKPGYVRTAMTQGMRLPPLITASPEQAARDIAQAVTRRRNVIYTRWMWRYLMWIIRHLPEPWFKRLRL